MLLVIYYTVHGILQARILEWVAYPFSRTSSWPRNWTRVSCIAGGFLPTELSGKPTLPASWEIYMQVKKQKLEPDMEQWTGSKLGKGWSRLYILTLLIYLICRVYHVKCQAWWSLAGIKIAGRNINNLRYADDTTVMAESKEELKSLLKKMKEQT